MLVLSRNDGETICIGDDIVITVIGVDRGKIRLGIEAPKHVPVVRGELKARPDYVHRPPKEPGK